MSDLASRLNRVASGVKPGLLVSPAREALKEVRRLEERLEHLEAEMADLREALHAHANAVNAAILRLEREWRKGER